MNIEEINMQELEVANYVPPFITETDEARWDDCTVCSTLMATASATLGETVANKNWSQMSKTQLKVLRERIRNHLGPDDQSGGTNIADMRVAFAKEYPWLPQIPSYEEQKSTWEQARYQLLNGWGGVYMGNPSNVQNEASPLRRWTNSDNFGHAIWVDRARKNISGDVEFFVMDPLGRGDYSGQWVDEVDLKQFTWVIASTDWRYITLFKRGGWSRTAREIASLKDTVSELRSQVEDANRAKDAAVMLRNAAIARADAAEAKVATMTKTILDLKEKVQNKNAEIDRLKARLQKCKG
jgi:hypothetical protein